MEVRSVNDRVYEKVKELVTAAALDLYDVDEVVYVGGFASLPGLDETLSQGFTETVVTPFTQGTVVGGGIGDPTTILARGCALQAKILAQLGEGTDEEREVKASFTHGHQSTQAKAMSKTLGLLFPEEGAESAHGGQWIPVVLEETPVPARCIVSFDIDFGEGEGEKKVEFEVWEAKEGVKIERVKLPRLEDEEPVEGEEQQEEEEEEVKEKTVEKESLLTSISFAAQKATQKKGRWSTRLEVTMIVGEDGALEVSACEFGASGKGEKTVVTVPAA